MVDASDGGSGSVPPTDVHADGEEPLRARIEHLETVIEGHQLTEEARVLQEHLNERHQALIENQKQQRDMRKNVLRLALGVIAFMAALVAIDICMAFRGTQGQMDGSVRIALFVSPILSITTITIFLLVGAFRGFREKDMENLPFTSIVSEAGRVLSGR